MTPEELRELQALARQAKEDLFYGRPEFWDGTDEQEQFFYRALEILAPD